VAELLVARRYAKALFANYSNHLNDAQTMAASLGELAGVFADRKTRKMLTSPAMPKDLKIYIFNELITRHSLHAGLQRFIELLVDAGRVGLLPAIHKVFTELLDQKMGVFDVNVMSATQMDDATVDSLKQALEKKTGKKPRFNRSVDPSLLAGFVLKMGNNIIDLSSKAKLEALAKTMTF
jgi:F-type H+-transporting ATPase subunit delta